MAQARQPRQQPQPPAFTGGPGDEPAQELPPEEPTGPETLPPAAPAGTSVKINGREFTVEPELAAALEGREQEFNRRLSEQGRELGDHRAWRRDVESRLPPKAEPKEYDYDTQLFERPRETLNRFRDEIVDQVRQEYQVEQKHRGNWERFYKNNPDLVDEDRLVRAIANDLFQRGWGERDASAMPEFMEELAREARSDLLRISRKTREGEAPSERLPRGRSQVESGGGGRRGPEPAEPQKPSTLSDMILAKQRRHRAAVAE